MRPLSTNDVKNSLENLRINDFVEIKYSESNPVIVWPTDKASKTRYPLYSIQFWVSIAGIIGGVATIITLFFLLYESTPEVISDIKGPSTYLIIENEEIPYYGFPLLPKEVDISNYNT